MLRYIEANPLRAGMVRLARAWPWSSLAVRRGAESFLALTNGPVELPASWESLVQQPLASEQVDLLQNSIKRGAPLGARRWKTLTATKMRLESTVRPRGRPKK